MASVKIKVLGNNILVKEVGSFQLSADNRQDSVFLEVLGIGTQLKEKFKVGDIVQKRRDAISGIKYDGLAYPPTPIADPTPFFIQEGSILGIFDKSEIPGIKAALKDAEIELKKRFEEEKVKHDLKQVSDNSGVEVIEEEDIVHRLHQQTKDDLPN